MNESRAERWPWLIGAVGLLVWGGFLWNFTVELGELTALWPPLVAVLLGTGLSFALVYAGYRFARESWIGPSAGRRIVAWGIGGLVGLTLIEGLTVLVRLAENRIVAEPQLDLLVSLDGGMLAGVLVGYLYERARHDAERARETRDALGFLNETLRHECLNGLNIVRGNAEVVRDRVTDEDARRRLSTVENRCTDMTTMIRNIRAFADTFMDQTAIEPVDLSEILGHRVELTREAFPDAAVTLDTPPDVSVRANETLTHVFENLLQNAIEHNDKETPEVAVTVDVGDETVAVAVADNGPGIPESRREQVFSPDLGREHRFGLYLVETLVTHYGGEITVSGNDPEGTIVTTELPRASGDG